MHEGLIIVHGTPEELIGNPKARRVYLGETFHL
jgi:ABC-type lipopolysaccharide export system ATPase subunit